MCRRFAPVFALAIAAALHVHARDASACSPLGCATFITALPPDGTAGVPLNSELRVHYHGSGQVGEAGNIDLTPMRLVPAGQQELVLRGARLTGHDPSDWWLMARPDQRLAPDTEYELQVLVGAAGDACAVGRDWTTVSRFTTAAEVDTDAPEFDGIATLSYGARQRSGGCASADWIPITPALSEPRDASPVMHFNVYVDGELNRRFLPSLEPSPTTAPQLAIDCSLVKGAGSIQPGADLEVRAVDLAGNESAPGAVFDVAQCGERGATYDEDMGCSLSRRSSSAWSALLALPLLLLLRSRRGCR